MKYSELIEVLKHHADKDVWFTGVGKKFNTEVVFFDGSVPIITLSRAWGKEEVRNDS